MKDQITLGDGVGILADVLAHTMVDGIADRIGKEVKDALANEKTKAENARILITNDRNLASKDLALRSVSAGLERAEERLNGFRDMTAWMGEEEGTPALPTEVAPIGTLDQTTPPAETPTGEQPAPQAPGEQPTPPEPTAPAVSLLPILGLPVATNLTAAAAALKTVTGAAKDIVEISRMLLPEYSVTNRDLSVGTTPLLASIAGELAVEADAVGVEDFTTLAEGSALWQQYVDALKARNDLALSLAVVSAYRLVPLRYELDLCLFKLEVELGQAGEGALKTALTQLVGKWRETEINHYEVVTTLDRIVAGSVTVTDPATVSRQLEARINELRGLSGKIGFLETLAEMAGDAVKGFDELIEQITTPAEGELPVLLTALLQEDLTGEEPHWTHVLFAGFDLTGGEIVKEKWLLVFPRLSFLAAANASFMLYEAKGRRVVAGDSFHTVKQLRYKLMSSTLEGSTPVPI